MTEYKCGCVNNGVIILDDNELSMLGYFDWIDTVGLNGTRETCFNCYCSHKSRKEKA